MHEYLEGPLVPRQQSQILNEAPKKSGVEPDLHLVRGAGQGNGFGQSESQRVPEFLREHLKPAASGTSISSK